jgi:hypothetical protein
MAKLLWTQRTNFGPGPRNASSMAFDSNRNRVVLFGGSNTNGSLGDTWEWDGSFWTQMEDIGPAPRFASAMVYDSARQVSLLFGGTNKEPLGDTWQWDGADWTKLSESGPSPRVSHAMAFDSTRNRTVLFGGQPAGSPPVNDTWEFDGQEWTQQQDTGPAPRSGHSMAYDSVSGRVILFGGIGIQGNAAAAFGDTWAWDGNTWAQIAEFGPSGRGGAAMAAGGGNLILFGGVSSLEPSQTPEADTWGFDGKLWTQRQDIGPGPLQNAAMTFDSNRSCAVLFGGLSVSTANAGNAALNPLSGSTWESLITPTASSLVGVSSLVVPGNVIGQVPTTLTINLSGPAPQSGALVALSGGAFTPTGANLPSVTIPAGLKTLDVPVAFAKQPSPVTTTITAQIAGTPAVSLQILVGT